MKTRIPPYSEVRAMVLDALYSMIKGARGNGIWFRSSQVAKRVPLPRVPVIANLVKEVIEELCERGLVRVWSESRRGKTYYITKDSPLWKKAKRGRRLEVVENT